MLEFEIEKASKISGAFKLKIQAFQAKLELKIKLLGVPKKA